MDPVTYPAHISGHCDYCHYPYEAADHIALVEGDVICDACVLDIRSIGLETV